MTRRPALLLGPAILVVVVLGALFLGRDDGGYSIDVVMPDAANVLSGSRVTVDGFEAGSVSGIDLKDGKAVIGVALGDRYSPLPAGTTARIEYQSLLGERNIVLETPDEVGEETIPDGGMIPGAARTDLDQVLAALDDETLTRMQSLLPQVDALLSGRENDINTSLQAAGPAVEALGEVLAAIGQDGPMLAQLIEDTRAISQTVASRRADVAATLQGLTAALQAAADEREDLGAALDDLPATLAEASAALDRLPATVDAVDPLLAALRPAIDRLPGVATDLRPLLADLRPAVSDLEPALAELGIVLSEAPALLDLGAGLIPTVDGGLTDALPIVDFLRPYTPELVGWLSNWGGATANYDANGRGIRLAAKAGPGNAFLPLDPNAITELVPSLTTNPYRQPGELVDQPWTDANGDPIR